MGAEPPFQELTSLCPLEPCKCDKDVCKQNSGSLTRVEIPTQSMHYISSASLSHEEPASLNDYFCFLMLYSLRHNFLTWPLSRLMLCPLGLLRLLVPLGGSCHRSPQMQQRICRLLCCCMRSCHHMCTHSRPPCEL